MVTRPFVVVVAMSLMTYGCDVPEPEGSTGGIDVDARNQPDGGASASCGRGVVVIEAPDDYSSTNVSLVGLDGTVLSPSFISSATASAGLTAPLGTDVVSPSQPSFGRDIVLIDRWPSSTLLWVDVQTAEVTRRLSVATGFTANPQDYAEITPTKAYVTRFEQNGDPGREPFDTGSDVLVIDPSEPQIVASIDMRPALGSDASAFLPRPDKIAISADRAFVILGGYDQSFSAAAWARLVTIDTRSDSIADVLALEGLRNCPGMTASPDGHHLAIMCAGDGTDSTRSDSGIAIVNIEAGAAEEKRFAAGDFGEDPVGFFAAYSSDRRLLFVTFGRDFTVGDRLVEIDLETNQQRIVADSGSSPYMFGDVRCASACQVCFAADATPQSAALQRYVIDAEGAAGDRQSIRADQRYGLPPRFLGRF